MTELQRASEELMQIKVSPPLLSFWKQILTTFCTQDETNAKNQRLQALEHLNIELEKQVQESHTEMQNLKSQQRRFREIEAESNDKAS